MNLPGCDATERKPGRELCAEIDAEKTVSCVFVGRHGRRGEEIGDAGVTGKFAAIKGMGGGGVGGPTRGVHKAKVWR